MGLGSRKGEKLMKKFFVAFIIISMLALAVAYNLPIRTSQNPNRSQSDTVAKQLGEKDLATLEGGIRLKCVGVLFLAAGFVASGPMGLLAEILLSGATSLAIVCGCDKELDNLFGTHFRATCN